MATNQNEVIGTALIIEVNKKSAQIINSTHQHQDGKRQANHEK